MATIIDDGERILQFEVLPVEETRDLDPQYKIHIVYKNSIICFDKCRKAINEKELQDIVFEIDGHCARDDEGIPDDCQVLVGYTDHDFELAFGFDFSVQPMFLIKIGPQDRILVYLTEEELKHIRDVIYEAVDMRFYEAPLRGKIKKITINAHGGLWEGIPPQRLEINNKGNAFISCYDCHGEKSSYDVISLDKDEVGYLFLKIFSCFSHGDKGIGRDDAGHWDLTVENEAGEKKKFEGSTVEDIGELNELSVEIRELLNHKELLLFDGNAQVGTRVCYVKIDDEDEKRYYKAEDENIQAGDKVIVPIEGSNRRCIGKVICIEYFKAYLTNRLQSVIGKYEEGEGKK